MSTTGYVIQSKERSEPYCYFVAIHGYSPHFNRRERARVFPSFKAASDYAKAELFTTPDAFAVKLVSGGLLAKGNS